jgi:uracil-DNA glycosylase
MPTPSFILVESAAVDTDVKVESIKSKMMFDLNALASQMEVSNMVPLYQASQVIKHRCPTWMATFDNCDNELRKTGETLDREVALTGVHFVPDKNKLFRAFEVTPLNEVRVVIIGQDPYPQVLASGARAQGLSFSVAPTDDIPGSLQNIYKELAKEYQGYTPRNRGDLEHWAKQGVLLLNWCLTCIPGKAGSHAKFPLWASFILQVIKSIAKHRPNCIYVLWGAEAQKLEKHLGDRCVVLKSSHPSGLSCNRGFFGNGHFLKINELLTSMGEAPILW